MYELIQLNYIGILNMILLVNIRHNRIKWYEYVMYMNVYWYIQFFFNNDIISNQRDSIFKKIRAERGMQINPCRIFFFGDEGILTCASVLPNVMYVNVYECISNLLFKQRHYF